jgi:hypothetical protein
LANTDLTQQIRAAVTGWNQRYLESIYAGSGLVLASLLFEILVEYLLVFCYASLLFELSVDYLLVFILVKLSFYLVRSLCLMPIWITVDYCVKA